MTRGLNGKPVKPRPVSLYQRAKVALSNSGIYLRGASVSGGLTASNILDAIARYEGRPRPKSIGLEFGNRLIEAWLIEQERPVTAPVPDYAYSRPLKLSKEMRARMARCDPARLPSD